MEDHAHPLAAVNETCAGSVWEAPFTPPILTDDLGIEGVDSKVLPALYQLAVQGLWREVADKCRKTTTTDTATALSVAAYRVLALTKQRLYPEAAAELGKLGDLDDPSLSRAGAPLAPFALRWLAADLPALVGQQGESVARFQLLLSWCQQRVALAEALDGQIATWQQRRGAVARALAGRLCRVKQHRAALAVLNQLLQQEPADWGAWTQAGLIQLQMGDAAAARRTFEHVAQQLGEQQSSASAVARPGGGGSSSSSGGSCSTGGDAAAAAAGRAVRRRRGLLLLVKGDYSGAAQELSGVLAEDPTDATAANNLALCYLYSADLEGATRTMELAFRRAPAALLQEPVVANLASIYELAAPVQGTELKRAMAKWISAAAPDDFDLTATKII